MTLTIDQMYYQKSTLDFCRRIQVKRKLADSAGYEPTWHDVTDLSGLKLLNDNVTGISYILPNNSYNFGILEVGSLSLEFDSKNGQFDAEDNYSSIFFGYERHASLIRVLDGYTDVYTDPNNPVDVYEEVFYGFIDGTSNSTHVDNSNLIQYILGVDVLGFLLKSYLVTDIAGLPNNQSLIDTIYSILNRPEFTAFFNVSLANINPGYNITDIDLTKYAKDTTLYNLFQNLSLGHSYYYVDSGVFYYKPATTGNSTNILIGDKKLINVSEYQNGVDKVYERVFWEDDDTISYSSPFNKYNRSLRIGITGVIQNVDKEALVIYVGNITRLTRKTFKINIPYLMTVKISDIITVQLPQIILDDTSLIWGVGLWGVNTWGRSSQADNIPTNQSWLVREVRHAGFETTLVLEQIIPINIVV